MSRTVRVAAAAVIACIASAPVLARAEVGPGHVRVRLGVVTVHSKVRLSPASIARVPGGIVAANYQALYLIRPDGRVKRLPNPSRQRLVPAGVFFRRGLLYVANYRAGDVLVFRYPSMRLALKISDGVTGPEGVFATRGAIDIADFDGSDIARFTATGQLEWTKPLPEPHGITELNGHIFATSLGNHSIVEVATDGSPIAAQGALGTAIGDHLWPVGLRTVGGRLLLADAHQGRISRLTAAMETTTAVGGNGPGLDAFNYPFDAIGDGKGGYIVADTLKQRLVYFDSRWRMTRQVVFNHDVPSGRLLPLRKSFAAPWFYTFTAPTIPLPTILGLQISGESFDGYNSIDVRVGANDTHELELTSTARHAPPFFYSTWAVAHRGFVMIGSPEQGGVLVIDLSTWQFGYTPSRHDMWEIHGHVRRANGKRYTIADALKCVRWTTPTDAKTLLAASPQGAEYLQNGDLGAYLKAVSTSYYINVPDVLAAHFLNAST
jgi:DNA-binding beta-propeller fold protein YncE